MRVKRNFHRIWIAMEKPLVKWGPSHCGSVGQNEVKLWYIATGVLGYGGTQVEAGFSTKVGAISMGESPSVNKTPIWDEESGFMIKIHQLIREYHIRKCSLDWINMTVIKPDIVCISDWFYINGLVQERSNSIANTLELCLSCTNPSICGWHVCTWCKMSQYFLAITVKHFFKIWSTFS